ncbi:ras GTPAse, putative [Plasmodium chabaudi adami]|uniref:Ras GTPAse, putative n=1 Tax=Plasmodium chabaudi adami TaxID=5826 RepID=A0A1C6YG31_PLACE|nr:ras GTPAse, putative [Plasmodium chabaudi adami]
MKSLKILVLGDLGVGKSSFLRLISERFDEIYPINYFDYFMYLDEEEKKEQFVSARDLAQNNSTKQNVETIVESMFFQAKKNFLEFIENKMNAKKFFVEKRHKYTYGFEIYPFLWNKNNSYNNNIFEKNIPLNIIKNKRENYHDVYLNNTTTDNKYISSMSENNYYTVCNSSMAIDNDINTQNDNFLYVEFFEIGGVQTYSYIRNIFYEKYDGILLFYDSSNNKSYHNLVMWLYELYVNTKPPSQIFCTVNKKQNQFWNIFQKNKMSTKVSTSGRSTILPQTNIKHKYSDSDFYYGDQAFNYYNKEGEYDSRFDISDENIDIEKGIEQNNEDILNGEIPIACVATKIDKKNSKQKPSYVKTPKTSYLYSLLFSDQLSDNSSYENRSDLKIKKDILKKLEHNISQALEIKASSIDCIIDIKNFLTFLKRVYAKKYGIPNSQFNS